MHIVDYQYTCKTYAALLHTGQSLLRLAEKSEDGRVLLLQAAKVFSFFTLEAYLNHIGDEEVEKWDTYQHFPFNSKIKAVAQTPLVTPSGSGLRRISGILSRRFL